MFVSVHEHDAEQIRELVAAADYPAAARRLHRLKGSAATLGCRRLTAMAAALESALKSSAGLPAGDARLSGFEEIMQQSLDALRRHIEASMA